MSGGDWYARRYHTGDLSGTDAYIVISIASQTVLKATTIQIIFQNDPVFTGLRLKIYSYRNGVPANLIATSTNEWSTASLKAHFNDPTNSWARKHIYFEFTGVGLDFASEYAFVLTADTYTGDYSSHLGWVIDYPSPVYAGDANNNISALSQIGNVIALIEQAPLYQDTEKYLVRITPRDLLDGDDAVLQVDGATFDTYYWAGITKTPIAVYVDSSTLTERDAIPNDISGWYYDAALSRLYVSVSTSAFSGWPTEQVIFFDHNLYFSTEPVYTYSDPIDAEADKVHWEPWLVEIPTISSSVTDDLVGFIPTVPSSLTIANYEQFFNGLFVSTSFNKAPIRMWKMSDGGTISYLLSTLISDFSTDYTTVTFTVNDDTEVFRNEIRPKQTGEADFYFPSDFPDLDPSAIGRPKRIVYGVNTIKFTNLSYDDAGGDNDEWGVMAANMAESDSLFRSFYSQIDFSLTTVGSGTTRIYFIDSVHSAYFQVDDRIILINSPQSYSDPPDYSSHIRTISAIGANYIDINSSFTFQQVAGEDAYRCQVQRVYINQNGTVYTARPFVHYYGRKENGSANIKFLSGYAGSIGCSTVTYADTVFGVVEGRKFQDTDFAAAWDDSIGDAGQIHLCALRGVGIVYELLSQYAGVSVNEIAKADFLTEIALGDSPDVSFAIPQTVGGSFPTVQEVLNRLLLSSGILRLYKDPDLSWTVSRVQAFSSANEELDDNTIFTISSKYSYQDVLSEMVVKFNYQETTAEQIDDFYDKATFVNEKAKYFHKIDLRKEIELYVYNETYVDGVTSGNFGTRLYGMFAERQGRHTIQIDKNAAEYIRINDQHLISREKIGGKAYTGALQDLKTRVVEVKQSLNRVSLVLDDQLGLGDNS